MAEEGSEVKDNHKPFLEVLCTKSGKLRRFSVGTEAGFAVSLINKKLIADDHGDANGLRALYIEAVKEDEEEPVSFGPNSLLVDYGSGWKLQTVLDTHDYKAAVQGEAARRLNTSSHGIKNSHSTEPAKLSISFVYIAKILLAFLLIFVFGAGFTLVLENLPQIILYINSSL